MNRLLLVFVLLCFASLLSGQVKGPHGEHLSLFRQAESAAYAAQAGLQAVEAREISRKCLPSLEVYGWHPAWSAGAYMDYDFPLLNTLSWFAYEVDPATGSYLSTHGWTTTGAIQMAHDGGSQVDLTVFLGGEKEVAKLLSKKKSLMTLRDSVVALLDRRDADGVCLDFEGLTAEKGSDFIELTRLLSDTLHRHMPVRKLTITLPAQQAVATYPIKQLIPLADRFVVKAYGTQQESPFTQKTIETAVDELLSAGMPPSKLLLGLPYYGCSDSKDGNPAHSKPVLVRDFGKASQGLEASTEDIFPVWKDEKGQVRLRGENDQSLLARVNIVKRKGLSGIAVWGLGYDHGEANFWSFLKKNTADCSAEKTDSPESEKDYSYIQGSGMSSAERNEYNWVWMLGGGAVAVVIMLIVRKLLR